MNFSKKEKKFRDGTHPLKITVIKVVDSKELFPELPEGCVSTFESSCPRFKENQVFYVDRNGNPLNEFPCQWAWNDNFPIIKAMRNGVHFRQKREGIQYTCCTDGLRPVIFRIEWCDDGELPPKREKTK